MVVTINDIGNVDRWQTVFIKGSIGEARVLNNQLSEQLISKKQELRALVGDRYRDLLKTADLIIDMNETMETVDSKVFKIGAIDDKKNWINHNLVSNKFNNPSTSFGNKLHSLQTRSTEAMLISTFNTCQDFIHKIHENYLLVAELLTLLEVLIDTADQSGMSFPLLKIIREKHGYFRQCLDNHFKKNFICYYSSQDISLTTIIDQFTAFAIHYKFSLNESLVEFLHKRLEYISSVLNDDASSDEESLIKALFLISITVQMVNTVYVKGYLQNQLYQRHSAFALLESPGIVSLSSLNISKYKKWMPLSVKSCRAVPENCVLNIMNERELIKETTKKMVTDFSNSVVEVLSVSSKDIISRIVSVDTLVSLRQKLLALLDADETLRELKTADGTTWLTVIFREAWTERFHTLIKESINGLSRIGETVEKIYAEIIADSDSQSQETNSNILTEAVIDLKGSKKNLKSLLVSLSKYSKGQFGYAEDTIRECEVWEVQHQDVLNTVEIFGRLSDLSLKKSSKLRINKIYDSQVGKEDYSGFGKNDEEEDYSQTWDEAQWKKDELSNIKQDYDSTIAFISSSTSETFRNVVANLRKAAETTSSTQTENCRAFNFLLRVLLHFHHSMEEEQSTTEELLCLLYKRFGFFLSSFIENRILEHISFVGSGKEPIINNLWVTVPGHEVLIPHSPTPNISAIVYLLCQEATNSLGKDQYIWGNKLGLAVLNNTISATLANKIMSSLEGQKFLLNANISNDNKVNDNIGSDQLAGSVEDAVSIRPSEKTAPDTSIELIVETDLLPNSPQIKNNLVFEAEVGDVAAREPDIVIYRIMQLYMDIEYLNSIFSTGSFDSSLEILRTSICNVFGESAVSVCEALTSISVNYFQKTKMLYMPISAI